MSNEYVFCGLCGHRDVALFSHIRSAHGIDAAEYERQCPNAPLFSESFGRFVSESQMACDAGAVKLARKLFGLSVPGDLLPCEHVPVQDEDYVFDEKLSRTILMSLLNNDRILLVGATGCGKSSLVAQLAARMNWPLRRVNLHGETSVSDFVGQWVVEAKEMKFRYGVLPSAMRDGQILVLEEIDGAEPATLFVLQGVMEENGALILTENGGEIVRPHPRFRIVGTANTIGLGDETGLYAGTHVLNAAHLDRWTVVFNVGYLPDEQEESLLLRKVPGLDRKVAKSLVKLANAVRKAAEQEQVFCTFSTRRLLFLASKVVSLGSLKDAMELTVLNKLAKNDRQVVYEIAQRHFPELESARAGGGTP